MRIEVPIDIDAIELGQFQRWSLANTEDADRDFLLFKTIEIFCGVDMKVVSQFPLEQAEEIAAEIFAVMDQKKPFQNRFTLGGVEYGFIPSLEAMTIGEYIDLENGLKDTKEFHKAAAVLFRPIVKSYDDLYTIKPYDASPGAIQVAKTFPLGVVSAAIVFFYNIVSELQQDFQDYSWSQRVKMDNLTIQHLLSSARNGDGIKAYMPSQEETQQK